jgi:hypothetical protein
VRCSEYHHIKLAQLYKHYISNPRATYLLRGVERYVAAKSNFQRVQRSHTISMRQERRLYPIPLTPILALLAPSLVSPLHIQNKLLSSDVSFSLRVPNYHPIHRLGWYQVKTPLSHNPGTKCSLGVGYPLCLTYLSDKAPDIYSFKNLVGPKIYLIVLVKTILNPLNAELNPICHLLVLLGDLTFMGTCIVSIFQYISN